MAQRKHCQWHRPLIATHIDCEPQQSNGCCALRGRRAADFNRAGKRRAVAGVEHLAVVDIAAAIDDRELARAGECGA